MKPETQNWIALAAEDYEDSLYLFKGARHSNAVYHLCQAVEKILKAVQIERINQPPAHTHDLGSLARKSGLPFSEAQLTALEELFRHYKKVRYRDYADRKYNTKAKVAPIIKQGKELYQWISTSLSHP
jgi:HEPN domain-containing protein